MTGPCSEPHPDGGAPCVLEGRHADHYDGERFWPVPAEHRIRERKRATRSDGALARMNEIAGRAAPAERTER